MRLRKEESTLYLENVGFIMYQISIVFIKSIQVRIRVKNELKILSWFIVNSGG